MKKIIRIFSLIFIVFVIVGCEGLGGSSSGKLDNPLLECVFEDATFDYDGEIKSLVVENLPAGAIVEYINNEQTEVGVYDVKAKVILEGYGKKTFTAKLTIVGGDSFKNCTFRSAEFTYDGEAHGIYVANVPANVTVEYENNEAVEAGTYVAKATLTDNLGNTKVMNAKFQIKRAIPEIIVEDNQTFIIVDSNGLYIDASVNNDEQQVKFDFIDKINGPGQYKIKVYVDVSKNYNSNSKEVTVNFVNNVIDLSFEDKSFVYDGTEKTIVLENVPEGYSVEYFDNVQVEAGRHRTKAVVKNDNTGETFNVYGILVIDRPDSIEFEQFMDELFVAIFEGDQISINFFLVHPENYGLEHYEASLGHANYEDYDLGIQQLQDILDVLYQFDYNELSHEQQMSYDIVDNYFTYLAGITLEMQYMTNDYLGSYLGSQANLPLELSEYKFRNEEDIKDFINILETSEEAFMSYYEFSLKQNEYGYGLSNIAIDNVISQCQNFVDQKEDHYLVHIFNDKIDKIEFELSEEAVAEYKKQCEKAVKEDLCNAYQYIIDNLGNLKDADIVEGGLANYGEEGLKYYELMFKNIVGYNDITMDEVIEYIDEKLNEVSVRVNEIVKEFRGMNSMQQQEFLKAVNNSKPAFSELAPDGVVALFQQLATEFVPDLGIMPEITIKYVYESLEDNYSPAAYFVSPLDETRYESIYLNGKYTDDTNYIFTTLAHEGYPGHLYQNVYAKQLDISNVRKVLRCQGYMEGWATYMEFNAYSWVTNYTSKTLKLALEYLKYNDMLNGLASSRADLGIHIEGWDVEELAENLSAAFGQELNVSNVQGMYDQLVEIPTNSSMYYFSYCKLQDMHDYAEEELALIFNEVSLNKVILDCGAAPLEMVEEAVKQFIEEQKYLYGLK